MADVAAQKRNGAEHDSVEDLEVSIVVPTRNEVGNVGALLERLTSRLTEVEYEVIFVDDSDDETDTAIAALILEAESDGPEITLLHRRRGQRNGGLSGAVVAGIERARGTYVCVIDGDLQHPPETVARLLQRATASDHPSMVVATRYSDGGSSGLSGTRALVSRTATAYAKRQLPKQLAAVSDPMAGFFLFRRDCVDPERLQPNGFKIMLEVLVRTPGLAVAEVGYVFGNRSWGTSKASLREVWNLTKQLRSLRAMTRHALVDGSHCYDIHGIINVQSDSRLPELDAFRVRRIIGEPSIRVRVGKLPAQAPTQPRGSDLRHLRYREVLGNHGFAVDIAVGDQVTVLAAPPMARSPHVLYTNVVEPILRWRLVELGYALAHGAVFVSDDKAYMVTALTDTGKTTTMLKLLDANPELGFISDDLSVVSSDGTVRCYPKPLTISAHTAAAVDRPRLSRRERSTLGLQSRLHSRGGRHFAFFLAKTGLPVASLNMFVQFLVPPPKYPVDRLVPGVPTIQKAKLVELFVIQREKTESTRMLEPDEAREILLSNTDDAYGFPPYDIVEAFLLEGAASDLKSAERQIIGTALQGCPASALASSTMNWAERIPQLMHELTDGVTIDLRDTTPMAVAAEIEAASGPIDQPAANGVTSAG